MGQRGRHSVAREFSQSNRKGRNTLPFFQKQKPETPGLALGVTLAVPAGMSGTRTSGVQVPAMRGRGRRQTDVRAHRPHWAPAFIRPLTTPRGRTRSLHFTLEETEAQCCCCMIRSLNSGSRMASQQSSNPDPDGPQSWALPATQVSPRMAGLLGKIPFSSPPRT